MTDVQLAFLLRQFSVRLRREVADVQNQLSQPIQERRTKNFLGGTGVDYPILDDLWETVTDLDKSIERLEANGKT